MKNLSFLLIISLGMLLGGCQQKSSKNKTAQHPEEPTQTQRVKASDSTENKEVKEGYLISDEGVGHFKLEGPWRDAAEKEYHYQSVQGYGTCVDAACDGGFVLGNKIIDSDGGEKIEKPELFIGAVGFDESESKNEHASNTEVFYIASDNRKGWYWKDKINYVVVYSDSFKTKEGIGVGTTLEELQKKFKELDFYVGWVEEDVNALEVVLKPYPNINFILDIADYKGNEEEISLKEDDNSLTISDFKPRTSIKRMIVHQPAD